MTDEETIERLAQRVRGEALARALAEVEAGPVISCETEALVLEACTVQAVSGDEGYGEPVALNGDGAITLDALCIEAARD